MRRHRFTYPGVGAWLLAILLLGRGMAASAAGPTDVVNTKHNLSVSGPGTVRALTETRICIFCHTPHNATPKSPLWNKELEPREYRVYASPTLVAGPLPQPSGTTKLCLSCHDGTIAMGAVVNPAGGIAMASGDVLPADSLANFGLDLSGHHPVSFSYQNALPNPELVPAPPPDLAYGGNDEIQCTTCHDAHSDRYGDFLAKDNRYSALCVSCHQIPGWSTSAHATSTASVVGVLPRPPKTSPNYTQLNEWGCEVCHTPHFAPTAEELLNFTDIGPEPFSCTTAGCHSSGAPTAPAHLAAGAPSAMVSGMATLRPGAAADIGFQVRKLSAHHEVPGAPKTAMRIRGIGVQFGALSSACVDCHNPHLTVQSDTEQRKAPFATGSLRGVSGVDRNGLVVESVHYEYEVCFKCHSDFSPQFSYIPRVINETNTRRQFDPTNSSFHPVVATGINPNVPSIPSSLMPSLSISSMIYCTACHADDEGGSRGPHGSSYPPILRERYETADNTPENFENYALCYRCHERQSILRDDSFKPAFGSRRTPRGGGHSGHLRSGAPCSACHDAHGVSDSALSGSDTRGTGSHTNLINFDTRIVLPKTGTDYPTFTDTGTFSGTCNLLCHGVEHDNWSYP